MCRKHSPWDSPCSERDENGFIIADKMPLADFVDHLSRYHSGILRCDPAVADLTISGAFPVNDVNAALTSTSEVLAIRIERYTRYFVMIKPAWNIKIRWREISQDSVNSCKHRSVFAYDFLLVRSPPSRGVMSSSLDVFQIWWDIFEKVSKNVIQWLWLPW